MSETEVKNENQVEVPVEPPKRKRGRPRKTEGAAPVRRRRKKDDWPTLMEKLDEETVVEYNIESDFSETEAIRHKKFGIGIITKVLDDNKIEVVFEEDKKVLAQNWEVA